MKTPDELATELMQELSDSPRDWDFRQMIVDGIERDRAQREVTAGQYDLIIEAIDRAKNDDESLDSEEYASIVLDVLKLPVESMAPSVLDETAFRQIADALSAHARGLERGETYGTPDEARAAEKLFRDTFGPALFPDWHE